MLSKMNIWLTPKVNEFQLFHNSLQNCLRSEIPQAAD